MADDDDLAGLLKGHDARGQPAQALQSLVDRGFGHAEVTRGVGLGVAALQLLAKIGGGDFRAGHGCLFY